MLLKVADWIAIIGAMGGSTLIALDVGFDRLGYVLFLVSGIASLYLLKKCGGRTSLMFVTSYFLVTNVVGFYRH